jgi:hypothetical protein
MRNELVQYALFKTLYDKNNNILECFYPFFLRSLVSNKSNNAVGTQERIKRNYNIYIPIHVLDRLCLLGIDKKHIKSISSEKRNNWPILLEEDGNNFLDQLETESDVERKINYLSSSLSKYLEEFDIIYNTDKVTELLLSFIKKNNADIYTFFLGGDHSSSFGELTDIEIRILEYCIIVNNKYPDQYEILNQIFLGSVYESFLVLNEKEIDGVINYDFSNCKIYFDANFLFHLFGFHDNEYALPARELFSILTENKFQFRVFDFTISEMTRLLRGYINEAYKYPKTIKIDSLYSTLKRSGKTESDVIEIIINLENMLLKKNIFKKSTGIELEDYIAQNRELNQLLWNEKPHQHNYYHNHDIALLEKIKAIRTKKLFRFEDADCYVVTSDFKLARINHEKMGHKTDSSIEEVLLDRILTNLLFIKKPTAHVTLNSIISMFSRNMFIKHSVWENFYSIINTLKGDGKIDDNQIVNLFYRNYVEFVLIRINENDNVITPDFILDEIEKSCLLRAKEDENKDKSHQLEIEKKQSEIKELFSAEIIKLKEEHGNEKQNIIQFIENEAKGYSKIITLLLKIFISIMLLSPMAFALMDITRNTFDWKEIMNIIKYVMLLLSFINFKFDLLWTKIENIFYERSRKRKLGKLKLLVKL